jgi:phage-related protein
MERTIVFYKDYFLDFYEQQSKSVRVKIDYVLQLISVLDRVPEKFLKHIEGTDGLYEVRVEVGKSIFRIFCFFDEGRLVIVANGFQKKSQKTPKTELDRALKIKKEYEHEKSHKLK